MGSEARLPPSQCTVVQATALACTPVLQLLPGDGASIHRQ